MRLSAIVSITLLLTCHSSLAECRYRPVADLAITYSWPDLLPLVQGAVNGRPASFLFNTDSYTTFLTSRGALSKGLAPTPTRSQAMAGDGVKSIFSAYVKEFAVGPSRSRNIEVAVLGDTAYLDGYDGMVGADYATHMDLEIALADKKLRFYHAAGCEQTWLGYWDQDAIVVPYFNGGAADKRPRVTVQLNGKNMVAVVSTGASHTAVFRKSAERAGVTIDADTQSAGMSSGITRNKIQNWTATFEFKLGDETVRNARLRILDEPAEGRTAADVDMQLGQDWLRRHRLLLSQHQRKAYFSYLGGELFGDESDAPWYKEEAEAGVGTAQLALSKYYKERGRNTESDAWMQKALASGEPNAAYAYGRQQVVGRNFAPAVELLQTVRTKQPDNIQAALWLYLAQEQIEGTEKARSTLAALPPAKGEWWYAPVIDFYLGKVDSGEARARAQAKANPRHVCEARRFITLKEMISDGSASQGKRDWTADWCESVR